MSLYVDQLGRVELRDAGARRLEMSAPQLRGKSVGFLIGSEHFRFH